MKNINPLDICAYYLSRGYSVEYMDIDPYRLDEARKLRLASSSLFIVTDAAYLNVSSKTHTDVCIAVNVCDFHYIHKNDWLSYGYQSIQFHI